MKKPLAEAFQKRLKDELRGVKQGGVDLHPAGMQDTPEEVIPDIGELGVPAATRRKLEAAITREAELGEAVRSLEKERDAVKASLREVINEAVGFGDEVPKFYAAGNLVSRYATERSTLSKDVLRDTLLSLGVPPEKIARAFAAATVTTYVQNLRITPPKGATP